MKKGRLYNMKEGEFVFEMMTFEMKMVGKMEIWEDENSSRLKMKTKKSRKCTCLSKKRSKKKKYQKN